MEVMLCLFVLGNNIMRIFKSKCVLSILLIVVTSISVFGILDNNPKVFPISIVGDTEGIDLHSRFLDDGRLEIIAVPSEKGKRVLEVMSEVSEDIEQTYDSDTGSRTIVILNKEKPVKIIFNGVNKMEVKSESKE